MKQLVYILFFFSCFASAQIKYPHTNRPDITRPLLDRFIVEAELRGIEVRERISRIDSIMVIPQPIWTDGTHSDGICWQRGSRHRIELKESMLTESGGRLRLFFHELAHAFGVEDCCSCTYNIIRCQTNPRANMLFKDEKLTEIYFDVYFEAIRNPKKYNDGHTHY